MSAAPPATLPVANALSACAAELDALSRACDALQHALGPLLVDRAAIEAAQGLDLVTQSLAALSEYLDAVSCQVPDDWSIDPHQAAAGLTLADLAERLKGEVMEAAALAGVPDDLDIFGDAR
jgi:hypothetical protein